MSRTRVRLLMEYDGAAYSGWQRQPDAHTVQGAVEEALATILREPVTVFGQGRTDAGVHAEGQAAHADLPGEGHVLERLKRRLNRILRPSCALLRLDRAPPDFHARFHAAERRYRYQVVLRPSPLRHRTYWEVRGPLDEVAIRSLMGAVLGEHEFGAFCSHSQERAHTRCVVRAFTLEGDGAERTFRIAADRFLHNMVRRLVGDLVAVGRGRRPADQVLERLDSPGPARDGLTAPAHGLILEEVVYPDGPQ
ncbi:MAG: tRNA pseudouridine(38-40) synthase TruA [bacterium]